MDFRLLGPAGLLDEGRPVALDRGTPRALLAVLFLHPNEALMTGRLIDELWAEHAPHSRQGGARAGLAVAQGSRPAPAAAASAGGLIVTRGRDRLYVFETARQP
jgi:hypothetical protein